jgi:glutamate/tyrosine decarboxylase-like PLP-dependent enzyme
MKTTHSLADALKKSGFSLVVEPTLNIVAFRSTSGSKQLAEKLWRQGWFVSYVPRYDCIRVVLMPHVKTKHVLAFMKDLNENQNPLSDKMYQS